MSSASILLHSQTETGSIQPVLPPSGETSSAVEEIRGLLQQLLSGFVGAHVQVYPDHPRAIAPLGILHDLQEKLRCLATEAVSNDSSCQAAAVAAFTHKEIPTSDIPEILREYSGSIRMRLLQQGFVLEVTNLPKCQPVLVLRRVRSSDARTMLTQEELNILRMHTVI